MILLQHVYTLKNLLTHGISSDDFSYSDRLIAHVLRVCRATLIEQKINKYNPVSPQSHQDLCVPLALSNFHGCCDVPSMECKILRSTFTVPKFLTSRWGNYVKVSDMIGVTIPEFNLTQNRLAQWGLVTIPTSYFLHNNYLYVINNSFIDTVLLNALFDNPEEIYELNCNIESNDCGDYLGQEFPLDSDLIKPMYEMALDMLTRSMSLPKDEENDAKDQTREGI